VTSSSIHVSIADVAATLALVGVAVAVSFWRRADLERDIGIAVVRSAVQLIAIGYVPPEWTPAAWTSSNSLDWAYHQIGTTAFTFPVALTTGSQGGIVAVGRQLDRVGRQIGIDAATVDVGGELHLQTGLLRGPVRLLQYRVFRDPRSVLQRFLEHA